MWIWIESDMCLVWNILMEADSWSIFKGELIVDHHVLKDTQPTEIVVCASSYDHTHVSVDIVVHLWGWRSHFVARHQPICLRSICALRPRRPFTETKKGVKCFPWSREAAVIIHNGIYSVSCVWIACSSGNITALGSPQVFDEMIL